MKLSKVDLAKTHQFSSLFLDYLSGKAQLTDFYGEPPRLKSFETQIATKEFSPRNRKVLSEAFTRQYADISLSPQEEKNLDLLQQDNTYTVTTGHQLNIFTGPLYFIYKIITVVNTCKALKEKYPHQNFIPVYWMATEDHDFEEISYFKLHGRKYQWETDEKGAVGRFSPKALSSIIDKIPGMPDFFKEAYTKNDTLTGAVRSYVHHLFQEYGLLALDGDDIRLKSLFKEVIKNDLLEHTPNALTEKQSKRLEDLGYKTQVYPRDINFFYLEGQIRGRLLKDEGKWTVVDTNISFTLEEINELIEEHPERFSPNVILRPLYQEMVLPNLAYVGGPAEVIYWLQLKPLFDHFKVAFPVVMPRNFAMIIPKPIEDKMKKTDLVVEDLFAKREELIGQLVKKYTSRDIELNGQKRDIVALFDSIKSQAQVIDPTLGPHVEAQQTKVRKSLDNIEKKFLRAEKKNQTNKIGQVTAVLDYLWPQGNLQERSDNFLNFYMENPAFIDVLITYFEPFDYRFNVLMDG